MSHIQGQSRQQGALFPEVLDDFIPVEHPVRVVDAFVNSLNLDALGFTGVVSAGTGRPGYHPADLLKLYIHGYLNQVSSSSRLARECTRNLELPWLLNRLLPSFKTIADFRAEHPLALVGVCRGFSGFCRQQSLFGAQLVAIDGTKPQAVASRKRVMTPERIASEQAVIDARIGEYLSALDATDAEEAHTEEAPVSVAEAVQAPRARRGQLQAMAEAAKAVPHTDSPAVVADTGHANGEQARACQQAGITAIVPRPEIVNPKGQDYFTRGQFEYDPPTDTYRCPAGQTLACRRTSRTNKNRQYWSRACGGCAPRARCTGSQHRVIVRSFFEADMQAMHARAMSGPRWMRQRRCLAEHPFGTMKWMMGTPRFLPRGLTKVRAEFALSVLTYNLKRVIAIVGVKRLLEQLRVTAQPRPLPARQARH